MENILKRNFWYFQKIVSALVCYKLDVFVMAAEMSVNIMEWFKLLFILLRTMEG